MELFIKVSFWMSLIGVVLRMLLMCMNQYPRSVSYSLAEDNVYTLLGIAWTVWAGSLVF